MAENEEKDRGRTGLHGASNEDAALGAGGIASTGGDGSSEKGRPTDAAASGAATLQPTGPAGRDAAASDRPLAGETAPGPGPADPSAAAIDGTADSQQDLTRRERERLMRRQLMLDAARAVFAERGYGDATIDEVAARAEFGKGTLYNYFEGGKEEILFAIFDDLYDALCRLVDATLSPELVHSSPFRQVFEGFLTAIFAFFLDRQDQFMILMKEGHRMMFSDQPEKAQYFQKQGERVIKVMMKGIEAAQAKGELRAFPSIAIANMIMGNVKGYHMHRCMEGCRGGATAPAVHEMPTPEESARFLSTFLLDGMLAPPQA